MIGEIDLQGVFIAPLLIWMTVAYALNLLLRRGLAAIGFYRLVWHRALFDLSLYIALLGGVAAAASHWTNL
ncbi:MAG: DUF1656 domain-containing protein [Acetobacteraceae bacterium]